MKTISPVLAASVGIGLVVFNAENWSLLWRLLLRWGRMAVRTCSWTIRYTHYTNDTVLLTSLPWWYDHSLFRGMAGVSKYPFRDSCNSNVKARPLDGYQCARYCMLKTHKRLEAEILLAKA